jgi:hypothetical protein
MRYVVDEIVWWAFNLPVSPVSLPLCREGGRQPTTTDLEARESRTLTYMPG